MTRSRTAASDSTKEFPINDSESSQVHLDSLQSREFRAKLAKGSCYDVHALKIKVGGLMFMTTDMYAVVPPGRTEKIVPLARKTFGDKMAIYADSIPEAIVGKLLESTHSPKRVEKFAAEIVPQYPSSHLRGN
ncbi:MAG: hypothetical protein ACRD7E_21390 [Bryobacteraceae bacterium]